ncbi:MAG TPA: hypothetical protein VFW22_16270 [Pseudolabrys sp.]|nr:hypothetical protein [Pseudolabrys sp.]
MRAILINPFDRVVSEIDLVPGLAAKYAALSGPGFPVGDEEGNFPTDPIKWEGLDREPMPVRLIDVVSLGEPHDLVIDDEGRFADNQACFGLRCGPDLIAGRALLVQCDDQGDTVATTVPIDAVRAAVVWLPWDTDYTPSGPTFISFSDDVVRKFL